MNKNPPSYIVKVNQIMSNISQEVRIVYLESDHPDILTLLLDAKTGAFDLREWLGFNDNISFENAKKLHTARPLTAVYKQNGNFGVLQGLEYYKTQTNIKNTDAVLVNITGPQSPPVYFYGPDGKPFFFQLKLEEIKGRDTYLSNLKEGGRAFVWDAELIPDHYLVTRKHVLHVINDPTQPDSTKLPNDAWCTLLYLTNADALDKAELCRMLQAFLDSKDIYPKAKLILTGATRNIPDTLAGQIQLIRIGAPTTEDIQKQLEEKPEMKETFNAEEISCYANALTGLTHLQLQTVYARTGTPLAKQLKSPRGISRFYEAIAMQKRLEGEKDNTLVFREIEENPGIAGVGGFLKWLNENMPDLLDPEGAKSLGITPPKGVILAGVPGTGKSQLAKQMAYQWKKQSKQKNVSLIEFNIGNLSSSEYGKSEEKMERFLARISEQAPAILFIDEVEKTFYQATDGQQEMHEVKKQQMGRLLGWLQDHKENIFTFMTSNNINALPPELIRSGRLSERFFVFMPTYIELMSMLYVFLRDMAEKEIFDDRFNAEIKNICKVIDDHSMNYGKQSEKDSELDAGLAQAIRRGSLRQVLINMTKCAAGNAARRKKLEEAPDTIEWDKWMNDEDITMRTPFMTGADMKELVRKTILLLRRGEHKKWTGQQFAQAMETCCTAPEFSPYGQSNLEKVAKLYLGCDYPDTSANPLLPRYTFNQQKGKFNSNLPGTDNLYDLYMQQVLKREIEKAAAEDQKKFQHEQMEQQRKQWKIDDEDRPQQRAFQKKQMVFQEEQMDEQRKQWKKDKRDERERDQAQKDSWELTKLQLQRAKSGN